MIECIGTAGDTSSGNHAIAVALAAASLGVAATIVMPQDAPAAKVQWTRDLGALVEMVGPASDERAHRASHLAEAQGLEMIEPYDSFEVLAATGTIALEVLEDLPGSASTPPVLYGPVSGGGLAGGVATAASEDEIRTAMRPIVMEARLVAEPSGAVAAAAALAAHDGDQPPRVAVELLSGGNVEEALLTGVLRDEVHQL